MKKNILFSVFSSTIFGIASYAQNQFPSNGTVQINNVNINNRLLIQQTTEPTGQNLVSFITGQQRGIFFKDRPTMQGGLWLLGGGCCYPEGDTRYGSSGFIGAGVYGDGASFIPTANQASFMRFQEGKIDFYGINNLTPGSVVYPTFSAAKMSLTSFPNTQLNVNGELRGKELTVNTTSDFRGFRLSYNDGFPQAGWGDVYFDNERWGGYFTWRLGSANGYLNVMRLDASNRVLTLDGELKAKSIKVRTNVWADYVFASNYKLQPLAEVEKFIQENKHLPNIPSEKEILENGIDVSQMQEKHMQKIEELTLYVIELEKQNKKLQERLEKLEALLHKSN